MTTEQMDWLDDERAGRHKAAQPDYVVTAPAELIDQVKIVTANGRGGIMFIPDTMSFPEGSWRSQHPVTDGEEHGHYTREGRDRCAAGDHEAAELFDRQAEAEKIAAHESEVSMAEEPVEQRIQRAWLNGFTEGVQRAMWGNRWDR